MNPSKKYEVQYVILIRHGSRDKPYNVERREHHLENRKYNPSKDESHLIACRGSDGKPKSLSLAGWLAEALHLYDIKISATLRSEHKHVEETESAYLEAIKSQKRLCEEILTKDIDNRLNPETFRNRENAHLPIIDMIHAERNGLALMITGHQPQLTSIAKRLTKRNQPLPLRQSEAACIQLTPDAQLLWAISESHSDTVEKLKSKIQSKMDVSKFFAGFISILLGFLIKEIDSLVKTTDIVIQLLAYAGSFLILLSLVFCVATMFAYDCLLMPSLFWSGDPYLLSSKTPKWTVRRPPSQVHWILYFNMVRAWRYLFLPAVVFLFLGLSSIFLAKIGVTIDIAIAIILSVLVIALLTTVIFQPSLGFDD